MSLGKTVKDIAAVMRTHQDAAEANGEYLNLRNCVKMKYDANPASNTVSVYDAVTDRYIATFKDRNEAETALSKAGDLAVNWNPNDRYNPAEMSAAAINKELDSLDKKGAALNEKMIAAGRGHETYSQTMALDPNSNVLTRDWQAVNTRLSDLRHEVTRRVGPGTRLSRLPRGFGPLRF